MENKVKRNYTIEKDWMYKGLRCVVLANHEVGHRCGYVGVGKEHICYGRDYDEVLGIDIHGGLTYSKAAQDYPVKSDLYFFGYDCGHCGDQIDPDIFTGDWKPIRYSDSSVKTFEFCIKECETLADQLINYTEDPEYAEYLRLKEKFDD